jgi:hypothetical protein
MLGDWFSTGLGCRASVIDDLGVTFIKTIEHTADRPTIAVEESSHR